MGSFDRFFAFLTEQTAGNFPTWLSPVQVKILPITEKQLAYAEEVLAELKKSDIRVELDESNETLGKKIRSAKMQKIPYLLVLGDKEMEEKMITIERRGIEEKGTKTSLTDFITKITAEIKERK